MCTIHFHSLIAVNGEMRVIKFIPLVVLARFGKQVSDDNHRVQWNQCAMSSIFVMSLSTEIKLLIDKSHFDIHLY